MHIDVCKLFCDLLETDSFSATAERHGVSQSAVSQKIRALESHFSAKLVERGRNRMQLTPEGAVFLKWARRMLSEYEAMHQEISSLQNEVTGLLKIATVLSIGVHELPLYVNRFREEFPEAEVRIEYRRAAQVYAEVIDGRIDLGLVAFPQRRKGLVIHSFWRDQLVVICSPTHPLAEHLSVRVEDLEGHAMVGFEPDLPTRRAMDATFADAGITMKPVLELDNIDTVKKAVELGTGFAIVPLRTVVQDVESDRLRALMFNNPNCWRPLGILGKRNRAMTPAMREFLRVLTHGRRATSAVTQPV